MDPLSMSAGLVGFIGFAVQVAKLVSKVKATVKEHKSASREIEELVEKLHVIEAVCVMV